MSKPAQFIIINREDGAARFPHVHKSLDAAQREATRLARSSPGSTFVVFQAVLSCSKADVTIERYDAAKDEVDDGIPF